MGESRSVRGHADEWLPRPHRRLASLGHRMYQRRHPIVLVVMDALAWSIALPLVVAARYEWALDEPAWVRVLGAVALAVVVHVGVGLIGRLYRGHRRVGSLDDAQLLAQATLATGIVVFAETLLVSEPPVPRSSPLIAAFVAFTLAIGMRLVIRRRRERRSGSLSGSQRVIVWGGGAAGQALIRSMMIGAEPGYRPVAVLDDDPGLRGQRIHGVPVAGSHLAVAEVAARHRADMLLVAQSSPSPAALREVGRITEAVGLPMKIVPPLADRLADGMAVQDLEDLDVHELLGREAHRSGAEAGAGYLAGARVLVTGAGGSIGSELCRQVAQHAPGELFMLDRDESALHAVQLSLYGSAMLDSPDVILADLRDVEALDAVIERCRPDVVFHAAALKHLPMLEQYPAEAWKSNVVGTANVLRSCLKHGVHRVVNVSTDKAASPTSVLGRSKRIGERLVAGAAETSGLPYLSVRFGNVLGSRGSVLTTFCRQLASGGPLTVTHPEVTRYFMTIPEAVGLVIQAGAIGRPGEALVLDMGQPVAIKDVAEHLMELAGVDTPIVYTGLREGEKLHEVLFADDETDERPIHPSISHVGVPALDLEPVVDLQPAADDAGVLLDRLCAGTHAGLPAADTDRWTRDRLPDETVEDLPDPRSRATDDSLVLRGPWRGVVGGRSAR